MSIKDGLRDHTPPDFEGFIDPDILERFDKRSCFHGDIINAQLIKTNRELIEILKKKEAER